MQVSDSNTKKRIFLMVFVFLVLFLIAFTYFLGTLETDTHPGPNQKIRLEKIKAEEAKQ